MKAEYDFSERQKGRFYDPKATLHLPVYLDSDLEIWLSEKAKSKNISVQRLVNNLLRRNVSLVLEVSTRL